MPGASDEFDWIASLRALTQGDPRALDLTDDAAVLPSRPDFDLVISKDAMVEGVHFLAGEAPEVIARRLLRTSLSDLAAKAADPFGYLLLTAWPPGRDAAYREGFRRGLEVDGRIFGVALLGGDTVSTPGPFTLSATVFGWAEAGRAVLRSGARAGDSLVVCGSIGDGWLGLRAARGEVADPEGVLADRYRLPRPLFELRSALRAHARAAADVSDGLMADARHVAEASGIGLTIELFDFPISAAAAAWCAAQADEAEARRALAAGGDDYALVCAVAPADEAAFLAAVEAAGVPARPTGRFEESPGLRVTALGRNIPAARLGWRHSDTPAGR
jgi:thiamine-monophosphate kinase